MKRELARRGPNPSLWPSTLRPLWSLWPFYRLNSLVRIAHLRLPCQRHLARFSPLTSLVPRPSPTPSEKDALVRCRLARQTDRVCRLDHYRCSDLAAVSLRSRKFPPPARRARRRWGCGRPSLHRLASTRPTHSAAHRRRARSLFRPPSTEISPEDWRATAWVPGDGVWKVQYAGTSMVVKGGRGITKSEAEMTAFVRARTSIPVPQVSLRTRSSPASLMR